MNIAIDNRLASYRIGGVPQYTQQLITAMARSAEADDRFTLIDHRKPLRGSTVFGTNIAHRRVWTPPHNRWEQTLLPLELWNIRADVIHFPDFIPLFRLRAPTVITIHDLAFLRYPQILDAEAGRYYGQIGRAVERADAIIAVSDSTRRDIVELLKVPEERVAVVHEAAAPHFQPIDPAADPARKINDHLLHKNTFALFVGTLEPRKNLPVLLHALRVLLDRGGEPPRLVVAGPRGWLDDPIFKLVQTLRLEDDVQLIGSVDARDLVWLYNACRVYLHPELYSGFGLPVLEAMQCGAPVLVADTSSLPEVAGGAAHLLPPNDVEAWAAAWRAIWDDAMLREQLRSAGRARAAQFSWSRAARETLEIYRRVGC